MERTPTRAAASQQGSGVMMIKKILYLIISHWVWFAVCLALSMGIAYLYLKKTPPIYSRTVSILIKPGSTGAGDDVLRELGVSQTPANITNEILTLNSSQTSKEVVRRLNLDVDYLRDAPFYRRTVYGVSLPLYVRFLDLNDNDFASLRVRMADDGGVTLSELKRSGMDAPGDVQMHLGDTVATEIGRIAVVPSPFYREGATCDLDAMRSSIESATVQVLSRIGTYLRDNNSTIINVSYRDVSPARAEDILNTLVAVYNENWMRDRNKQIISTNEFIKDRLAVIEQELGDVDTDISKYKSDNLVPNVDQMGSIAVSQATNVEQRSIDLQDQLYLARYIQSYLSDSSHDNQLIPFNSGLSNGNIMGRITAYNTLMLERNNHLANSSMQNPLVADLNRELELMRQSIIASLDGEITLLQTQQRSLDAQHRQAVAKIATNPQQAKDLLSIERQQKVKESLYLFLLQKREENELSQAFTAYNTQLVEPPHGSSAPIKPVAQNIYMIALLLGLAIPALVLFATELLRTTIRSREDIKQLTVPFAGEIPQIGSKKKRLTLPVSKKKKKQAKKEKPVILVAERKRDVVNEAFRVVRSNLEFMLGFESTHKIIMLTSFDPGSGKTFITANLSSAIGIKGKKVLAIDLDLRKGSLSEYADSPHHGYSDYLSGKTDDFHELIVPVGSIDILPCGQLPPNPAELLYSPRFAESLEQLRMEYDYVFIDCPPVEIVTDASIVGRYVDQTLFVIRAGIMEKSLLPEIEQWYEDQKYKNLAIVLNGTENGGGRYGYHKYGYHKYGYHRYGYGSGYGYGYGYGYGNTSEKSKA